MKKVNQRIEKLEQSNRQELLTLVEILSNATFFGEAKKANCQYAKKDQCSKFFIEQEDTIKIPIATNCRIKNCFENKPHKHIELSNITCCLCQEQTLSQNRKPKKKLSKLSQTERKKR